MIDIHCHILPGMDDGPENNYKSLDLARAAVEEGLHTIVATPHYPYGGHENSRDVILRKVGSYNKMLKNEKIALKVLPGQEVRISGTLLDELERGELLTVNDKMGALLIQFPKDHVPKYTERLFYDLQMKGIAPIIASPEQNLEIIENPEVLYQLIKKGAYAQVNAESAAGRLGRTIKKLTHELLGSGQAQFLGSNAHNSVKQNFKMQAALKEIKRNLYEDTVDMLISNAEQLISGEPVYKEEPERIKKVRKFRMFS
ncbi:tyrosine-protein phosphatase [Peribacillus sp. SCS-26]|uniref:tyrosine-protein phosphatase n=1 Tax=Paraperibacillus marinus TaxID=3115295 RepID=UPI003905BE4B